MPSRRSRQGHAGLNERLLSNAPDDAGVSRPASPSVSWTPSLSVSRPASPGENLRHLGVPSDMGTVNYVDFEFELKGGDEEQTGTDIIQPFAEEICEICAKLEAKYGFQPSSVRNQRENVLMLVANLYSNIDDGLDRKERAVKALHHHTLSSYENWARNMQNMKISDAYARRGDEDSGISTRLYEVVLWWCIWGEAANMRFMPEFLSWVFWSLVQNRDTRDTYFGRYEDGEGFLRRVMRPMYTYVSSEAFKKDMAGNNCDHSQKKNIDDINEYFWRKGRGKCVAFTACEPEGMTSLIDQLGNEKKTYVERRGLLHSIKSNLRVFTVYICVFHLVVAVAHLVPFEQDSLPLCPPQSPVDACVGVVDPHACERIQSCDWGTPPLEPDSLSVSDNRNESICYDNCRWRRTTLNDTNAASSSGPETYKERDNIEDCHNTLGCKWADDNTCRMFNSKTKKELLGSIDQTTYFSCDMDSAVCRYRNTKDVLVEYSCLERLPQDEQKKYKELNTGKFWEFKVTGLWDGVPIVGRVARFFNPSGDSSDMSANRANQTHMFDKVWAHNHWAAKHEFLEVQNQLFTCGFDPTTDEGIEKAANKSHCCNVQLNEPDRSNHGFVKVWTESPEGCKWSFLGYLANDDVNSYGFLRVEVGAVAITLMACRLLGEMLAWIPIWDSSMAHTYKLGKLGCAAWYFVMLVSLSCTWDISQDASHQALDNIQQYADQADLNFDISIPTSATIFQIFVAVALLPEIVLGSNSGLSAVTKLAVACCGSRVRDFRRRTLKWCQPVYVRKIVGRMSSSTWTWTKYSLIWAVLIWCKCYFSYVYEIRLAVMNEATTWRAIATPQSQSAQFGTETGFWDKYLLKNVLSSEGGVVVAWVVVFISWVPIFLVFVMDSQIAFSVCQMLVGVWTGVNLRVGHVNKWVDFEYRFARKLIRNFSAKLDASEGSAGGGRARTLSASFNSRSPRTRLPEQGLRGGGMRDTVEQSSHSVDATFEFSRNEPSFCRFAEVWNVFIHKLRYDDYLSDKEASLYKCMVADSLGPPWLPPFLALDSIATLLDRIDDLEDDHKAVFYGRSRTERSDNDRVSELWATDTEKFICELKDRENQIEIREAFMCMQTLTLYLLKKITGDDGDGQPYGQTVAIEQWFLQLNLKSCADPVLRKLMPDPTIKSGKEARDSLIATIADFADAISNSTREHGASKQRGQVFDRTTDGGALDMNKIATTTKALFMQIQNLCEGTSEGDLPQGTVSTVLSCPLFNDDRSHGEVERIRNLFKIGEVQRVATYLHQILKVRRADAVPKNSEASRRILTFASSLHMKMPKPNSVKTSKSLTSFTPFYAEDVLYTKEQIMEEKGQASMCAYLQTVHPDEWRNLVERLGIEQEAEAAGSTIPEWVWDDEVMATEVRLWASLRGQTLARTIHGVMQVEEGLMLLARQEQLQSPLRGADIAEEQGELWRADGLWKRYAHLKFQYVISCQIYGDWSEDDDKKKSVDALLRLFPHLRIAYVKQERDFFGENKWFSFLVRWCETNKKVIECYKIEQAADAGGNGNWGPTWLVGEGKPENQNHAIVFTRGQYLQTLDMNQDGYFEEGLKMRNLLEEFTADLDRGVESTQDHQVRIIGFPEHQFSDTLSAVAEFSALTEFTFATLIQRSLASPFDVRMHYGHPDLFDRVFHVTRGGISKPTKFLCVSEDIFGAFNSVLKGGRVIYREYIKQGKGKDLGFDACSLFEQKISGGNGEQALSRDFSRLCEQMGIARLMSFFHSSNGFYWSNVLVTWSTNWFLYAQILISVVIPEEKAAALQTVTQSVAFTFQLGMVLTVPLVAELILEKGWLTGIAQMIRVVCRGGPLFFMFHIRTKAYYYDRTLVLGGAGYKATGRGFVLKHTSFVQLFSMFHYSHLNYGMTLTLNLLVYRWFIVDPDSYMSVTWATWLFALDMLYAPFLFNCLALDRTAVLKDVEEWSKFLWRDDRQVQANVKTKNLAAAAKESWGAYFLAENAAYTSVDIWTRLSMIARDFIWVALSVGILLERNATSTENVSGHFWRAIGVGFGTMLVYGLGALAALVLLVLFWEELAATKSCRCLGSCRKRSQWRRLQQTSSLRSKASCCRSRRAMRVARVLFVAFMAWTVAALFLDYADPLEVVAIYVATSGYLLAFTTNCVFYMGFRPSWLYSVYWAHDAALGYLILAPFFVLSMVRAFSDAHMLLLYNSEFVQVINAMSFNSEVLQVMNRKKQETVTVQAPETTHVTAPVARARSRSLLGVDKEPEPEPELEPDSINALRGSHAIRERIATTRSGAE